MSTAALVAIAVALAGCGGSEKKVQTARPGGSRVVEHAYGGGARTVWVFRDPARAPHALVVFFHGLGDQAETTPYHHRPWLRHLAEKGDIVFYPRFEQTPGAGGALRNAILGVKAATEKVDVGKLPLVVIGYSRGGGLGFDFTAVAPAIGLAPRAALGVFPAVMDPHLDLRGILPGTRFVFLIGEEDSVVSDVGERILTGQLAAVGYPRRLVKVEIVHNRGDFVATHLSVLENSPGARAAFWDRADRLISSVTGA